MQIFNTCINNVCSQSDECNVCHPCRSVPIGMKNHSVDGIADRNSIHIIHSRVHTVNTDESIQVTAASKYIKLGKLLLYH